MPDTQIVLQLTKAEALVPFEWLARMDQSGTLAAEQQVLWAVEGQLERILVEPLAADYEEALAAARRVVRGPKT